MPDARDDLAPDLSAFRKGRDIRVLRSVSFLRGQRRPVLRPASGGRRTRVITASRYESTSPMARNARTADTAPPAGEAEFARLNAELGSTWFSYRKIGGGDAAAPPPLA